MIRLTLTVLALVSIAAPSFAGQIGSGSSNTFTTERYSGHQYSEGTSQSRETMNGFTKSSSAKSEFLPDPSGRGGVRAQFGTRADSQGNATGYCDAVVGNVDPACISAASQTQANFSKETQTNTRFGSQGRFDGVTRTVSAESHGSF
jgi:hypothetical protein